MKECQAIHKESMKLLSNLEKQIKAYDKQVSDEIKVKESEKLSRALEQRKEEQRHKEFEEEREREINRILGQQEGDLNRKFILEEERQRKIEEQEFTRSDQRRRRHF